MPERVSVFEEIFSHFFPMLDVIVEVLQAGYMEFQGCLNAVRDLIRETLLQEPRSMGDVRAKADRALEAYVAECKRKKATNQV